MSYKPLILGAVLYGFAVVAMAQVDILQLRQQANNGDAWAQLNLGAAYDHGRFDLPADPAQAVHWYELAAKQGIAEAQFNFAHCLATGKGAIQNYVAARRWMRLAAAQEMADAQFLLGVMLDQGLGGERDVVAAKRWLERAAGQGDLQAINYIKNH